MALAGNSWRGPAVPAPSPPALKVICAWCGTVIHDGPGPAESHGICTECRDRNFPKVEHARGHQQLCPHGLCWQCDDCPCMDEVPEP